MSAPRRIHFSTSWSLLRQLAELDDPDIEVRPRPVDWGRSGVSALLFRLRAGASAAWHARHADVFVLCNSNVEMLAAGAVSGVIRPRQRRIAVDHLISGHERYDRVMGMLLRRWHHFGCIRSSDRAVLTARFGIPEDRSSFIAFPAGADAPKQGDEVDPEHVDVSGYVYAAGAAHRDWVTFFEAMRTIDVPVVCGIGIGPVPPIPEELQTRLTLFGPDHFLSPERGRAYARAADVVVLPMAVTSLPSGPLVLLDAMRLGKAIVATDTGGTRDYVADGRTALVVPPADPIALAGAVQRLVDDPELRTRLGDAAAKHAGGLTLERFAADVRQVVR